jgi:2,4-dienoyl-CoA reductase (NADPH2)
MGGQIRVAASVRGRSELGKLTHHLEGECLRQGVQLVTGTEVDMELLRELSADVVIIATGARVVLPLWAGQSRRVAHARTVLEGVVRVSGRVLIVDELGFHQGPSVAETVAQQADVCAVTICTPAMIVGQDLGITLDMEGWQQRAYAAGIEQWTDVVVAGIRDTDEGVQICVVNHLTGREQVETFDWVVCATHQAPEDGLWRARKTMRNTDTDPCAVFYRIGDAVTPRRSHAAVLEGHRVAVSL